MTPVVYLQNNVNNMYVDAVSCIMNTSQSAWPSSVISFNFIRLAPTTSMWICLVYCDNSNTSFSQWNEWVMSILVCFWMGCECMPRHWMRIYLCWADLIPNIKLVLFTCTTTNIGAIYSIISDNIQIWNWQWFCLSRDLESWQK